MTNQTGMLSVAIPALPLLIVALLLPVALTLCFRLAAIRAKEQKMTWAVSRGFGRFIMAATVASWWMEWDLGGRTELPQILIRIWPWSLGISSAEVLLFWVPPIVSLGIFLFFCYTVDRSLLRQRWSLTDIAWRTWWRLMSFVIPLLMVAAGFSAIFDGKVRGIAWLLSAGIIAKVGTGFLRRAEGMKFNTLRSGELRNRALRMANQMEVSLRRVYMVPAGKGHLANAYGLSNAIGLTDSLGKYLTKVQVDYVIAHELAHVKLKHGRKHFLLVVAIFFSLTIVLFRSSQHAPAFRPLAELAVIIGPLVAIYYFSRRFEFSADEVAVEFTGEPETAIRALANLHKIHEVPSRYERFTELFMTHPALARRVEAIADTGRIPSERLSDILADAGI